MLSLQKGFKHSFCVWAGRSTCGCFMCGSVRPPGCSCDDVGSAAARSLMDPRDLEGDGDKRTQHNLEKRAVNVGDQHSALKHL